MMDIPRIKIQQTYTVEGKTFASEAEALSYREGLLAEKQERYTRVLNSTLPRDGFCLWAIYDEGAINVGDPPARLLKYVRGTREQAILHALTLPGFWGYGPGSVKPISVEDL